MNVEIIFPQISQPVKYYRVLHDYEIWKRGFSHPAHGQFYHSEGWDWRVGNPEVFWLFGGTATPFSDDWQRLSYEMNQPAMTKSNWRSVYDAGRAFMNGSGFPTPTKGEPRRDVINNKDLNSPLPEWDKIRVCGGATLRGTVDGDMLIVDTLKYGEPVPSWDELKQKPWLYFHATTSSKKATGEPRIGRFPQNQNGEYPVLIPLVARSVVRFPLGALEEVSEIADPYRIYIL